MKRAIEDVVAERERQYRAWGAQHHSLTQWLAILTEELGEAAKEVNEFNFVEIPDKKIEHLQNLREELVQVGAVALQIIEFLDKGNPCT